MKNLVLAVVTLWSVLAVPENRAFGEIAFLTDQAVWNSVVSEHVRFGFSGEEVILANEITELPRDNARLGQQLSFDEATTGLDSSVVFRTLERGARFVFNDTEHLPEFQDALSVGDINDYENDDFEVVVSGEQVFAFGINVLDNNSHATESIRLYGDDEALLGSSTLPDGDFFIGVISDRPIARVAIDERDDGDDIAISGYSYSNVAQPVGCSYRGVYVPDCERAFADKVIRFDPLHTDGPAPSARYANASDALSIPDTDLATNTGYLSIGVGGLVELEFTDNVLTNSGDEAGDLHVFEVGPDVEDTFVAVRPTPATRAIVAAEFDANKDGFYDVGKVFGGTDSIDLDAVFPNHAAGTLKFDAVQLVDDPGEGSRRGGTAGADIDAIAAISSAFADCDFDKNRACGLTDLNELLLQGPIAIGTASGDEVAEYDMNADGRIDLADLDVWLESAARSLGHPRPYLRGDADLDGIFGTSDLVQVFIAGQYEDDIPGNSTWDTGDWNGDLEFNTSDLVAAFAGGHYEGKRFATRPVPEVHSVSLLVLVILGLFSAGRRAPVTAVHDT